MNELFFELIRVAIGTKERLSRVPSKKEWGRLFKMAERQRLLGICFYGVRKVASPIYDNEASPQYNNEAYPHPLPEGKGESKISIPGDLYDYWLGTAALIQQQNQKVNRQCVEVQEKTEKEGFRTYIMKGQGNAVLYDETRRTKDENTNDLALLRQTGDIDIYLEGGFKKVMDFVNRTHPSPDVCEFELDYPYFKDTKVEIHYYPQIMRNPLRNRKLQRFFEQEKEVCFANKIDLPQGAGMITVPTIRFNLVHQMAHMYHHLFTEGIGLRQVMDYYFVLQSRRPTPTPSLHSEGNLETTLREFGMLKFAKAMMWVLQHVFEENNVDEERRTKNEDTKDNWRERYPWMIVEPNEKDGRFLLSEIMRAGNFGQFDDRLSHGKKLSRWEKFWRVNNRNLHLLRFNRWEWFWGPLWRIYHYVWRKWYGFI